jgi:anti-sigma factor RsiW
MRSPARHIDDNTVVDLLAGAVPLDDASAVAVHLATCAACRTVVEMCRELGDVLRSASVAVAD